MFKKLGKIMNIDAYMKNGFLAIVMVTVKTQMEEK